LVHSRRLEFFAMTTPLFGGGLLTRGDLVGQFYFGLVSEAGRCAAAPISFVLVMALNAREGRLYLANILPSLSSEAALSVSSALGESW
jgi:hypothetical protein